MRKERLLPIWDFSTHQARQYYRHGDSAHDPFSPATYATEAGAAIFKHIADYAPAPLAAASPPPAAAAP